MQNVHGSKTKDFYIACSLRASGFPLLDLERANSKQVTFVFGGSKRDIENLVAAYWDRQLSIDARAFVDAINELKTRMYSYG